ncbi:MAG: 30S ribosomal protein S9 [Verrucomicrobiales bacterium]|nr:30S ribosomal protein S9 [Verrucomicrobiales bacterium]
MSETFSATGRRKTSTARVTLTPGSGSIVINKRPFDEYFGTLSLQNQVLHPFQVANAMKQFDVAINTKGGGVTGQIGAIQLGIARALLKTNEELRDTLREEDLLTRDSRKKERKKAGQPKARKRFQFSKR